MFWWGTRCWVSELEIEIKTIGVEMLYYCFNTSSCKTIPSTRHRASFWTALPRCIRNYNSDILAKHLRNLFSQNHFQNCLPSNAKAFSIYNNPVGPDKLTLHSNKLTSDNIPLIIINYPLLRCPKTKLGLEMWPMWVKGMVPTFIPCKATPTIVTESMPSSLLVCNHSNNHIGF